MSNELCFLLWSKRQDAFYIEPVTRTFEINIQHFTGNRQGNDLLPIAIGTREQVESFAIKARMLRSKA